MGNRTRLSINVLELVGMVMSAYVVTAGKRGGSILVRRDNTLVVHWVQVLGVQGGGGDAVRAGEFMRLLGMLEDWSGWCFQARYMNGGGKHSRK